VLRELHSEHGVRTFLKIKSIPIIEVPQLLVRPHLIVGLVHVMIVKRGFVLETLLKWFVGKRMEYGVLKIQKI
jgi:hypothetical protein